MPYTNKVINETPPMATRSRIGIELSDGSVLSVYCHWDGYPEFNGVKLVEHFNSRDAVTELIDGGDISALWTNAGWNNETLPETGPLYFSSRGENCPPRLDANLNEYLSDGEEYAYVFTNGEWVCYDLHETPKIVEIPSAVAV
jgi:hypothetical protein